MKFQVITNAERMPEEGRSIGYLVADNWNDWFRYRTLYSLTYFDETGSRHHIGSLKIGQFHMAADQDRPALPGSFSRLDKQFFSLGQDVDYYIALMAIGHPATGELMGALNDIVDDEELYLKALQERVTGESLLRFVSMKTIERQFRRVLRGGAELTDYVFQYMAPLRARAGKEPLSLEFKVTPSSSPPTNIHVLIGRNGVGKTSVLNSMTRSLALSNSSEDANGFFISANEHGEFNRESPFANLLSITFSAFDDFEIVRQRRNATLGDRYTNVGLRKRVKDSKGEWVTITRDPEDLAKEFSESAKLCARGIKAVRWKKALTALESDPLFAEAEVTGLAHTDETGFARAAGSLYRQLSSGHKIVLLTITKLVENVEEKTLVLMDEPEAHLHPPLLSAFVRALSDLLVDRNGVAIIATHSPVILQEVPRSCVWKIIRHGIASKAVRPTMETFAESVGVLTNEIFGLEVTRSGFHKMLTNSVSGASSVQEVVQKFDGQVGSEGRALISGMIATSAANEDA
jgi:predicted ATPase